MNKSAAVAQQKLNRPNKNLPKELKDERIREVRDMSTYDHAAFQIVFDQHYMPYGYWNPQPDEWELKYARTEWHKENGFLGFLKPKKECICIVVTKELDANLFDSDSDE